MKIATTIEVVDLLTVRECIEILLDHRANRDRLPPLLAAVADELGTTHARPKAWIDEAKDQLLQALIAGEIGLYASRKFRDGANVVSDAFVRIPSEKLGQSAAFRVALPGEVLLVRARDSLAPFHGSEIRIRRSELEAWLRRRRKLFDRTKFRRRLPRRPKSGRPNQEFGLAVNSFRELYPLMLPTNKTQRQLAREVVAETASRYATSISLRTAQRAVAWATKRRPARI
jgi:hypothetical protein